MPENCTHDCSTCGESCSERDLHVPANALSSIKKVIAVVSGQGGGDGALAHAPLAAYHGDDLANAGELIAGGVQVHGGGALPAALAAGGAVMGTFGHDRDVSFSYRSLRNYGVSPRRDRSARSRVNRNSCRRR